MYIAYLNADIIIEKEIFFSPIIGQMRKIEKLIYEVIEILIFCHILPVNENFRVWPIFEKIFTKFCRMKLLNCNVYSSIFFIL